MTVEHLIAEAMSLPVEERTLLVDLLLRSLNAPESECDREWAAEAQRRLNEVRSGQVTPIPGEEVFARLQRRLTR